MKPLFLAAALGCVVACQSNRMHITDLPPIPDAAYAQGVSAPFCGSIGTALVVAGGANFPDKPLLEGGAKRVYDDIWVCADGSWTRAGHLPDSVAYGATFPVDGGLVLAGGNAAGRTTDRVLLLTLKAGRAELKELPRLPVPVEQAGWTVEGKQLYLAGAGTLYTCHTADWQWSEVAPLPRPLVQPVLYAHDGNLFLWGGFNPETLEVEDTGWVWKAGAWQKAPSIPDGGTFVGATACTLPDGRLAVVGGVNRAIFAKALHNTPDDRIPYLSQDPAWYRFRQEVYLFDGVEWRLAGAAVECALAGPGVAVAPQGIYVAGGELKPGVRSPKIFHLTW
ncbi:MAG: hypothetical protein IJ652_00970 [Bacteroidales bacterium]|nr:hypothetical protein [Bacteroidales bacterium]